MATFPQHLKEPTIFTFFFTGDKCDIKFEVNLEREMEKIYDILVLHLKGGKDMFIIVNGDCQKSCFLSSISTLCRAPVPLLQMSEEQRKQAVSV